MKVRLLLKKDIPEAVRMIRLNFSKKSADLARQELVAMFGKNGPKYIVAEEDHKIVGLAGYIQSWMDWGLYEVFWVNVIPHKQGLGIGRKIVNEVISAIKKEGGKAILLASDIPAFYVENFGFKTVAYYGKNRDHLMMLE